MEDKLNESLTNLKESDDGSKSNKNYGWGIRQVQAAAISAGVFVLFMARSCMGVAVLAMTDQRRLNDTQVTIYQWDKRTQSFILSSFFWGYMVMQIPGGLLSKKFGGKPVILGSLILNAVMNAALPTMANMGGWPMVCFARVVMGLTQACLFPTSLTLVGRWMPGHERTTYIGVITAAAKAGIIIGLPLYGVLAETSMGWPSMFYANAALIGATAVVWWKVAASTPDQHPMISSEEKEYIERGLSKSSRDNQKMPWRGILKNRHFWGIQVAHVGFAVFYSFLFVDLPTYLDKGLQISLKSSAILSALPYVAMFVVGASTTALSDKLVNSGLMSVTAVRRAFNSMTFLGVAGGLVAICFTGPDNKQLAVIITILAFSMEGFVSSGFIVNHLDLSPNFGGVTLSMTNTVANVFTTLTPIVTSFVLQNDPTNISRWHLVFLITAAIAVVTNLVYVILASGDRQPYDDPDYLTVHQKDPEELNPAWDENEKNKEAEQTVDSK